MSQPRKPKGEPTGDGFLWPATRISAVPWTTNPDQHGRDGRRPNRADRELTSVESEIPPYIANAELDLPADLIDDCRRAETDLSRLDAQYGTALVGLSGLLLRSESVASSRIEHVYADLDEIARAVLHEDATQSAMSTVAAFAALDALVENQGVASDIEEQHLLDAHRMLLEADPLEGQYAGRYRAMQNWIGGSDFSPRGAVHVPPPSAAVGDLMGDLVDFANRTDVPPLAQAALAHGQFESIHPFTDGNGRIGRGLIAATLRSRGVTQQVTLPIASVMLADVDTYFENLIAYRHGDAGSLIAYLTYAAAVATSEARVSAERMTTLPAVWAANVKARRSSSTATLLGGLLANPVLNAAAARRITGSSPPRTYEALERLAEVGILRETTGALRNRVWVVSDVMNEISDLGERIGRRSKPSPRWR